MDIVVMELECYREEDMDVYYVEEIQSYFDVDFLLENGFFVFFFCCEECY